MLAELNMPDVPHENTMVQPWWFILNYFDIFSSYSNN